jgi:hypothetical protein
MLLKNILILEERKQVSRFEPENKIYWLIFPEKKDIASPPLEVDVLTQVPFISLAHIVV